MKKMHVGMWVSIALIVLSACNSPKNDNESMEKNAKAEHDDFRYLTEQFADIRIMRFKVPGFEELSLNQKKLLYYLSEAALCGRDIVWDQFYKHNLTIRYTLENIYETYQGDKTSDNWNLFVEYLKRVSFSNGIHHHSSTEKFLPSFSQTYLAELIDNSDIAGFPLPNGMNIEKFKSFLFPILFDPNIDSRRVCQEDGKDLIACSANNFYENISQKEVEDFYNKQRKPGDKTPVSYGLNSKIMKENGKIIEKTYKIGGMYGPAIEKIVYWLEKAATVAENAEQEKALRLLIEYYKTGSLKTWDDYNIAWVKDVESLTDAVNGFIESYADPLGMKATFEGVVNFKDLEATKRAKIISANAQWFEDNSPVDPRFKKEEVVGVTAKVITTVMLSGDCYPSAPIGINLPNANWIREHHGSKSVTMENITHSYNQASLTSGVLAEFAFSDEEVALHREHGPLAFNLHTDLHECLGHGSGKLLPGVSPDALRNYSSPLEEARADLFALYYMMDPKMVELGLMPSLDVAKAEYSSYIRNGMMVQLTRIELGKNIEQAHMRCRALISRWAYEKGKDDKVIEKKTKDGKTYYVVNNHEKLRELFAELLKIVQRIKSEGDYEAGRELVEKYAVTIEPDLHKEVLERFKKLNVAPYGGFINPKLTPVMKADTIFDIKVEYPEDFLKQNLYYSKNYSFLPIVN